MSDQIGAATEPGWEESQDLPRGRSEQTREASPSDSNSRGSADQMSRRGGASSPESSSSSPRRAPVDNPRILAEIIAEALSGLSSVVSIVSRRRFGVSVQLRDSEAKTIAEPISRFISRRFQIRRDLNDASDATTAVSGFMSYVERIAESAPSLPSPPVEPTRVAEVPISESRLLSDLSPASSAGTMGDHLAEARAREVGAGPVKDELFHDGF